MVKFLFKRLGASLLVLLGVSILIFALARVIPGDPARIALGPTASAEQIAALRQDLHLDQPLIGQYVYFLQGVARGDLGQSLYSQRPVVTDIRTLFPATLELVLWSGVLMVVIGLPLGIVAARYRDRAPDQITRIVALLGVVTPAFVWAIVLMLVFAYWWGVMPVAGRLSDSMTPPRTITGLYILDGLLTGNLAAVKDAAAHLVLPSLALALSGIGQAARMMRTSMVETYNKPYTELVRAYGLSERQINFKYALRPAMIPTLTVLGLDFASSLGGAFLIETVFGWPGIAQYGVKAVLAKDLNAIVGTVLVIAAFFLLVNTLVDLLVASLNPRTRLQEAGS